MMSLVEAWKLVLFESKKCKSFEDILKNAKSFDDILKNTTF